MAGCPARHCRQEQPAFSRRSRVGGRLCGCPRRYPRCRSPAAGCCIWAMSWQRRSSRACGLPPQRRPGGRAWPSVLRRRGFAIARPVRRGWWRNADLNTCSTSSRAVRAELRASPAALPQSTHGVRYTRGRSRHLSRCRAPRARVHRGGRCVSGQLIARGGRRARRRVDPVAIYQRLRATNPSPFAALLQDGDFACLSSSPERLVSIRGNTVSTRPIAGTRPRGATAERRCGAGPIAARTTRRNAPST